MMAKMDGPLQEKDWKYMRRIKDELLYSLCSDINQRAAEIASSKIGTPHERYLSMYKHLQKSDDIMAECFNDWRRSQLVFRVLSLRKHGLLTDEHLEHFSEDGQMYLKRLEEMLG